MMQALKKFLTKKRLRNIGTILVVFSLGFGSGLLAKSQVKSKIPERIKRQTFDVQLPSGNDSRNFRTIRPDVESGPTADLADKLTAGTETGTF
ncbi:hypothetical protein Hs30E_02520 [Lactococcus hodotermopsidis]|uniref:Uncharacterized protein n=1 Tax=Pseudolactococcus hodotermopsidis TaxID=2709157 RepID=A0A6A0BB66_9LACT|nr:hypothetical protein [Lactococcus hodotermopsidis]GFH41701.1 hypothetical protein Hs30E_02520 [Lactococcus hodotermopsidis]